MLKSLALIFQANINVGNRTKKVITFDNARADLTKERTQAIMEELKAMDFVLVNNGTAKFGNSLGEIKGAHYVASQKEVIFGETPNKSEDSIELI
ncbi:hypothetical protein WOSG25_090110 [Weissella oryzae SG25]|uniref:Uncharacterized protein n=1 Tax=Weissella oryzae (strain DSM 25784 / JCM 18191 / LMG 30913 / SG25) TaxID=1329250 RepID=A0A069CV44_WEIOS|nr:hypothetical protein [Weissella oryzae]GAK31314.1 hypothetical protein WOSG25_090110 [Weissella oryzae SG25]